jgi:hypothetical protein
LIVEGLVFRVVTASHPGDPSLEEFGCPRTEYLLTPDPIAWTCNRDLAHRFGTHRAAEELAHPNRWHAVVAEATKTHLVPERLRPLPSFESLPAHPVSRSKKRKSRAVVPPVKPPRQSWVNEVYG